MILQSGVESVRSEYQVNYDITMLLDYYFRFGFILEKNYRKTILHYEVGRL